MKKVFFTLVTALLAVWAMAQETPVAPLQYDMTFKGRGEATTVQTVRVENLTSGKLLEISGTDVLRLTNTPSEVGIGKLSAPNVHSVIYPNPSLGAASLVFASRATGNVQITVTDLSGRTIASNTFNLETGKHTAILPAMPNGNYIVSLRGNGINESVKWVSKGGGVGGTIRLEGTVDYVLMNTVESNVETWHAASLLRAANAKTVEMEYNDGELLRITGKSGNYSTIIMKRPTVSQDVEFNFIKCTDASGNHYSVVKIGNYYWMAENLKGTKTGISKKTGATQWNEGGYDTPMMAYYDYSDSNRDMGGFYSYQGALMALPEGWRLPTSGEIDATLKALKGYEIPTGDLLKGKGNNFFWNTTSTGLDETSFGAKATGNLNSDNGSFRAFGASAGFWTRERKGENAYFWEILNNSPEVILTKGKLISQKAGLQVRCIVDAPSPYEKIIDKAFSPMLRSLRAAEAGEDDAPLGKKFIVTDGVKNLFISAVTNNTQTQHFEKINPSNWSKTTIYTDETDSDWGIRLKKAVAQTNESGRQNIVVADWKRISSTASSPTPSGAGRISLTVFADEPNGYEVIKKTTLNVDFNIVSDMLNGQGYETFMYGYQWTLQLAAGDINGDGVDDIFVSVQSKLAVIDGRTGQVIMQRDFANDFTSAATNLAYLRVEIGDVNHDGKNDVVVASSNMYGGSPSKLHVFLGGDITSNEGNIHYVQDIVINKSGDCESANIAIGDVTGDGVNYLVVYAVAELGEKEDYNLVVMKFNPDGAPNRKFEIKGNPFNFTTHNNRFPESLKLARLRGGGLPYEIVVGNEILRFDGNGFSRPYGNNALTGSSSQYVYGTQIVTGNFDDNELGKEQILFLRLTEQNGVGPYSKKGINSLLYPIYVSLNNNNTITRSNPGIMNGTSTSFATGLTFVTNGDNGTAPFPIICAAASNSKSKVLEYKSHTFALSEPRIHALMAAPPYYGDYDYPWDMGTSWGKSSMTGSGTENANTVSGSLILGFEMEFNAPIVGTKLGGVDFTTKLTMGSTWTQSMETSLTKSDVFTTWWDDAVVLSALPYETYTYTIVASDEEEQIGADLIIGFPGNAITAMITLKDYELMTANDPLVPRLRSIFKHTTGVPLSYPSDKNQIRSNVIPASKQFVHFGGAGVGQNEFLSIGSGGNAARSISVDTEMANSESFDFEFEAELVVTALGVKAGAGFGYGNSNTSTSKIGEGHSIAGIVAGLRNYADRPQFSWNVAWFNYTLGGQTFPVVYYVVK